MEVKFIPIQRLRTALFKKERLKRSLFIQKASTKYTVMSPTLLDANKGPQGQLKETNTNKELQSIMTSVVEECGRYGSDTRKVVISSKNGHN